MFVIYVSIHYTGLENDSDKDGYTPKTAKSTISLLV